MKTEVTRLSINNEMDVVLAHRRAMQIARFSGISLSEQTRFATAVSEICRNCLEYADGGDIIFSVLKRDEKYLVEAEVIDEGKGIQQLDKILSRDPRQYKGRGLGIVYARRLCDDFEIKSISKGTTVRMRKYFFSKSNLVSKLIIEGWKKHLLDEPPLSAYEELKIRNLQLLELTDELKDQKEKLDHQYEEIARLNHRLQKSNKNMQEFTYAVSHDLKTPLTSLKLSVTFLNDFNEDKDRHPYLAILDRAVTRLDKTIHGLIDILDIQNPDKHIIKKVDLEQLFNEVQEDFRVMLEQAQASVEADFSKISSLDYIEAYLKSIFINLISNSIKYKSENPLAITIKTAPTVNGVRLTYTDNGIGMDLAANKSKLFIPFSRLVTSGEGKGIGLYIIKTMVENNGGSIQVESTVGKGTKFIFDLVKYVQA